MWRRGGGNHNQVLSVKMRNLCLFGLARPLDWVGQGYLRFCFLCTPHGITSSDYLRTPQMAYRPQSALGNGGNRFLSHSPSDFRTRAPLFRNITWLSKLTGGGGSTFNVWDFICRGALQALSECAGAPLGCNCSNFVSFWARKMFFFSNRSEFRQKSNGSITKKLALHLNAQNEFEKAPCLATPPQPNKCA